jgi:HEAT repeat protein
MLVRFLSYAAPSWRRAAAEALGSIELDFSKGDKHGVVDALLPVLLDPDPDLSWSGYLALYLIGEPALPKLRWLMEINENEVPFPVLRVMAKLKADPETVLPKIAAMTRPGRRSTERATAARILSLYAPEHVEPLPVLIGMLRDRDAYVVRAARVALGSYGRVAIPALQAALRGRDPSIRREALVLLEELRTAK